LQHVLSSVIATNLKPHDAHAPSTFLLRIDSSDAGLSLLGASHFGLHPLTRPDRK
jgi:hypothetical protein